MSETTFCPYCNAKLRIASASKRPQRVKCTVCKNHFHPSQVVSGSSSTRWLNQPLDKAAGDREHVQEGSSNDVRTAMQERPVSEAGTPTESSINPEVIKAAYPEEMLERREARRQEEADRVKSKGKQKRHRHRPRRFQKILVIALVTIGFAGLGGAAWYLLRPASRSIPVAENPLPPAAEDLPRNPAPSRLEKDFAPKPLPKRMIGVWELRSDDERRGWIEFRSDNGLSMTAWQGDLPRTPLKALWFLIQEEGNDLVFEIGPRNGNMGNPRYWITFTGPDAFTLTSVKDGSSPVPRPENMRYVRWTTPAAAPENQRQAEK